MTATNLWSVFFSQNVKFRERSTTTGVTKLHTGQLAKTSNTEKKAQAQSNVRIPFRRDMMTLVVVVNIYLRTVTESSQLTCCIPRRGPLIYMHRPVIQSIRPTPARDPRPTPHPRSPHPLRHISVFQVHVALQCCCEYLAWLRICALDYYG